MPRIKESNKNRIVGQTRDISINDYANVPRSQCGRIKKNAGDSLRKQADHEIEKEELHWYEKNFSDDEIEVEKSNVIKNKTSRKKKVARTDDSICYAQYPFDLWVIISEYIPPEDVGRFALICKDTWNVTRTATFWKNLYLTYYQNHAVSCRNTLPDRLQPVSMRCLQGLRSCVIRSLFYTYSPFVEYIQVKAILPFCGDMLQKHSLLYFWIHKERDQWTFCFKFRARYSQQNKRDGRTSVKLHKCDADIFANSELHCYVLVAKCKQFTPLPPVITSTMILSASLMQKVASNMLRLIFDTRGYLAKQVSADTIVIDINGVQTVHVYPWWHPSYPIEALYAPLVSADSQWE